jgi:hypothetical protein
LQTGQGQPSEGTPMEVPEPRTVSLSGFAGISEEISHARQCRKASGSWPLLALFAQRAPG